MTHEVVGSCQGETRMPEHIDLQRETEEKARQPETKLSGGLGETAHRSPAGGTRRDVRARPTQGRLNI
jgi:hypothetical protein